MSRTAYEYRIVIGTQDEIEPIVEEMTESGWMIHGNHQVFLIGTTIMFSQVMIKPYEQPGA